MHFYQIDNLHAITALLAEMKKSEKENELTFMHLCEAGEFALKQNTETAYNTFMEEFGGIFFEMDVRS